MRCPKCKSSKIVKREGQKISPSFNLEHGNLPDPVMQQINLFKEQLAKIQEDHLKLLNETKK